MIRLINRYLLLVVLLILTGCSVRELTFDRTYPDTSKLDEFRKERQLEIEEEIRNLPNTIMKTKPKPRSITVSKPVDYSTRTTISEMAISNVTQYCWDYNYLDCERIIPIHPYDFPHYILDSLHVKANTLVEIYADRDRINLPFPFRIEVYVYDQNRNLNLYQTIESDSNTFELTTPSEQGIYMMLIKAYYDWEIDGISYHPVQMYVR